MKITEDETEIAFEEGWSNAQAYLTTNGLTLVVDGDDDNHYYTVRSEDIPEFVDRMIAALQRFRAIPIPPKPVEPPPEPQDHFVPYGNNGVIRVQG